MKKTCSTCARRYEHPWMGLTVLDCSLWLVRHFSLYPKWYKNCILWKEVNPT